VVGGGRDSIAGTSRRPSFPTSSILSPNFALKRPRRTTSTIAARAKAMIVNENTGGRCVRNPHMIVYLSNKVSEVKFIYRLSLIFTGKPV
jgi:hypothetical protein